MDDLTIEVLESLSGHQPGWCISLFIPTHRAGPDIRKNPIRLKNRLSEAQSQLEAAGVDEEEIDDLLGATRKLCNFDSEENRDFWQHQADGLAIFLASGESRHFRLAESFDELTIVAHRFHVKPLLQVLQGNERYCLLAVSQNNVRFLEGSRSGLTERDIDDLPEGMRSVVRGDQEKGLNLHSFRASTHSGGSVVPHGHAEPNEDHGRKRYFRKINDALGEVLDDRPLIFAGVEELYPYFKAESSYPHLVDRPINGSPDAWSHSELHERAWPIVESVATKRCDEELEKWRSVAQTELADTSLANVLLAAVDGRVDTLLLEAGRQSWGTFDETERTIEFEEEATAETYDLCDQAAIRTLRAGGKVLLVNQPDVLGDSGLAATFRFAAS